jgi:GNAT superfamily N-acetyltransferase
VLLDQTGFPYPPAAGAHRLRFAADGVETRIQAVRDWFRDRGRREFTWWVGTSATPPDLEARLLDLGAVPYDDEPVITSMVATEPPPAVEGVDVRPVTTFEELVIAREIGLASADLTEEQLEAARANSERSWAERQASGLAAMYLAYVDGEPVAFGDMIFLPFAAFLSGAGTRPEYRGRGIYRALVRARWDEAVRRGTPALIIGAGAMSRPILERNGFRAVAEQHMLVDRTG